MNDFLNPTRMRAWCRILAGAMGLWALLAVAQAGLGVGGAGEDLAADFTCFYSAGRLALQGTPQDAYDLKAIYVAEHHDRKLPKDGVEPVYYPPPYLLMCMGLALLPYWPALIMFLLLGLVPLTLALRRLLPAGVSLLPAFAFPGVLVAAGSGQNGLLSAALFAWFAVWIDVRPWLAGACLGVLACKPQLAMFAPLALLAAGRWRALGGAAACLAFICLLSLAVFGPQTWVAFLAHEAGAGRDLTGGVMDQAKIQSIFMAVRMLGGGLVAATAIQLPATLISVAALLRFVRTRPGGQAEAAALAAATMFATPYFCDYDLVCLAMPLAIGLARGMAEGWRPRDKLLLLAGYMAPLLTRGIATRTGLQLAPLALAGVLWVSLRPAGSAPAVPARTA